MSRLSENRISYLAHIVLNTLETEGLGDVRHLRLALSECRQVFRDHLQIEEKIDDIVRRKIASLSRQVVPGSREWDILYRQYFEEEIRKVKI